MKSPIARRKKRIVNEPKTIWPAMCKRNVPMNITAVNTPHMARYAAMAVSLEGGAQPNFARMLADIRAGVEMCRERCEYFSVCGGGEPVNKLAENGSFASTETTYCRLTKMRTTDLVLDALDRAPLSAVCREGASRADVCG